MLGIVDKTLPELHLRSWSSTEPGDDETFRFHLSRFTALTKLVCHDLANPPEPLVPTKTLRTVEELVLSHSSLAPPTFFEPATLISLQKLHLEGFARDEFEFYFDDHNDMDDLLNDMHESDFFTILQKKVEVRNSERHEAVTALLSLPKLSQITGDYEFIDKYIVEHMSESWDCSRVLRSDLGLEVFTLVDDCYLALCTKV